MSAVDLKVNSLFERWSSLSEDQKFEELKGLDIPALCKLAEKSADTKRVVNFYARARVQNFSIISSYEAFAQNELSRLTSDGSITPEQSLALLNLVNTIVGIRAMIQDKERALKNKLEPVDIPHIRKLQFLDNAAYIINNSLLESLAKQAMGLEVDGLKIPSKKALFQTIFNIEHPQFIDLEFMKENPEEILKDVYKEVITKDTNIQERIGPFESLLSKFDLAELGRDFAIEISFKAIPNDIATLKEMIIEEARKKELSVGAFDDAFDYAFPYRGKVEDRSILLAALKRLYESIDDTVANVNF